MGDLILGYYHFAKKWGRLVDFIKIQDWILAGCAAMLIKLV
jgi:hypothetical protein